MAFDKLHIPVVAIDGSTKVALADAPTKVEAEALATPARVRKKAKQPADG